MFLTCYQPTLNLAYVHLFQIWPWKHYFPCESKYYWRISSITLLFIHISDFAFLDSSCQIHFIYPCQVSFLQVVYLNMSCSSSIKILWLIFKKKRKKIFLKSKDFILFYPQILLFRYIFNSFIRRDLRVYAKSRSI